LKADSDLEPAFNPNRASINSGSLDEGFIAGSTTPGPAGHCAPRGIGLDWPTLHMVHMH